MPRVLPKERLHHRVSLSVRPHPAVEPPRKIRPSRTESKSVFRSFFAVWDFPPVVCAELALISLIYTLGFLRIQKTRPRQFPSWRWYCFMGGILALVVAVSSPLDTFSDRLLVVHMGQHFVLMSIAPPLIVFGAPVVPMLRGLPRWFVRPVLGPLIRIRWLREFFHALVQPK
ncbi:MAG: cytochrome c oxidase assembly protein, partial [Silvibacterium sp.]